MRDLLQTTDAREWAKSFVETWKGKVVGDNDVDEELMIGWFANAMCAQLDSERRKQNARSVETNHDEPYAI